LHIGDTALEKWELHRPTVITHMPNDAVCMFHILCCNIYPVHNEMKYILYL